MRVADLAKELSITSDVILAKLKSLRLKAKDDSQELNKAVEIVLRSEFSKGTLAGTSPAKSVKPVKTKDVPAPTKKGSPVESRSRSTAALEKVLPPERPESSTKVARTAKTKKDVPSAEESKRSKQRQPAIDTATTVTSKSRRAGKETAEKIIQEEKVKPAPMETSIREKQAAAAVVEPPKEILPLPALPRTILPTPPPITESVIAKAKPRVSAEPFVALKPLVKKKKKSFGKDDREALKPGRREEWSESQEGDLSAETGTLENRSLSQSTLRGASMEKTVDLSNLPTLELKLPISVKDFSVRIDQKISAVLKQLMQMGILAHINQNLDGELVKKLALDFGYNVTKVKTEEQQLIEDHQLQEDDSALSTPRAPVVTFMGHVDHGKTSLLDRIRKSRVAEREHGGITQHIGAYSVQLPKGKITFLDTPGHEAFTAMRSRGAHITDLVVLVVAADEGIMPQTEEAINHARAAAVPIIVALNKMDKRTADPDRVKKQLASHDLNPEDWGGKTITVGVSALTGEGMDSLLEMILLEAELLELKANKDKRASGIVIDAHLSHGKGAVASLIVQSGTLRVQDLIVVGQYYGKVKALFDDLERPIKEAGPSTPVEILGLPGVPEAGESFYVVQDEKQAKEIALRRQDQLKDARFAANRRITLEDLYSQIQAGKIKELNVIIKADVQGSVEALRDSLEKIPSSEVKVRFIHTGAGDVSASDVILAVASNAIIICFHVDISPRATEELAKQPVDVRQYRIIYDAVNDVRKALEGLLEPRTRKRFMGRAEVRQIFNLSKSGKVAGCYVTKGKITRKSNVDVLRNGEVAHSSTISTLKRFKDDVREVAEGFECGISVAGFDKIEAGDILEAYELETITRTL